MFKRVHVFDFCPAAGLIPPPIDLLVCDITSASCQHTVNLAAQAACLTLATDMMLSRCVPPCRTDA